MNDLDRILANQAAIIRALMVLVMHDDQHNQEWVGLVTKLDKLADETERYASRKKP